LIDTDLETDSIKVISVATPLVSHGRFKSTYFGTIIWELEFEQGFAFNVIPQSFDSNKVPFIDIRHSYDTEDNSFYQYYRYASNPDSALLNIDKDK
jgi:hypothetical protein